MHDQHARIARALLDDNQGESDFAVRLDPEDYAGVREALVGMGCLVESNDVRLVLSVQEPPSQDVADAYPPA